MGSNMDAPDSILETKHEPSGDTSDLSSSPEAEIDGEAETSQPQDATQKQKRKGGRKPIYATSEERKQRNRQAQAAFRERRTEYIKQLEATIKRQEEQLASLQQSQRSAADECLMLRYKNSLLERILLEKGIDVQAELRIKQGSPSLGPTSVASPMNMSGQPPLQRAMMNRQNQIRRSQMGSKLDSLGGPITAYGEGPFSASPHTFQPTPPSQTSSPSTATPPGVTHGVMSPPTSDLLIHQQQIHKQVQPKRLSGQMPGQFRHSNASSPQNQPPMVGRPSGMGQTGSATGYGPTYYPQLFQSQNLDHLDQEYDAHADMIEDQPANDQATTQAAYSQQYQPIASGMQQQHPRQSGQQTQQSPASRSNEAGPVFNAVNQLFDPYDPMLDADPFGLSATMQFPNQYSYERRPPGPS